MINLFHSLYTEPLGMIGIVCVQFGLHYDRLETGSISVAAYDLASSSVFPPATVLQPTGNVWVTHAVDIDMFDLNSGVSIALINFPILADYTFMLNFEKSS